MAMWRSLAISDSSPVSQNSQVSSPRESGGPGDAIAVAVDSRFRENDIRGGLVGRLFDRDRQRLRPRPAVLGDIEQHAFWAVELLFEVASLLSAMALVDVVLGAEAFELLRKLLNVLDQHAEMVDAAKIHALAELVGLEFENRHVECAVAQEHAVGEHAVRPPHLYEIEGVLIEFGHRVR